MKKFLLNEDWQFNEKGSNDVEVVQIPHTVSIEILDAYKNKAGIFEYRKKFTVPNCYENQRVFLHFEAAMMNCDLYVNGEFVKKHFGGYLPFECDVTDKIVDGENEIYVLLSNLDDVDTPPGKPAKDLDFLYYGGIYRDVTLEIKPPIYWDSALENGSVRIDTKLLGNDAKIDVTEHIFNTLSKKNVNVRLSILDGEDVIKQAEKDYDVEESTEIKESFIIKDAKLWDTENPNLYKLKAEIFDGENLIDTRITEFGVREVYVDETGFYLNKKKTKLFGLNRGQQFPYIGIAASNEAQIREARMLKQSGINCLRLSHYPQSPAFITECDRLGIMVIDPVPGWQFLGGKVWKMRLKENLLELIRRDRNHPSVIIFEVTPNESNWATKKGDNYMHSLHLLCKQECSNALSGGDSVGRKNAINVGFDVPYYGKDSRNIISRKLHKDNRLTLKREYGDWCFGGNKSTSRAGRGDGEKAMQIQTWNFQFDRNRTYKEGGIIGDLIWEGIDHNRGYYSPAPVSKSGVYDIFRLPKLSYGFIRSQKTPVKSDDYVIYLQALRWENKNKLAFYSNCSTLELYLDDKLIATNKCDDGPDKPFDKRKNKEINDNYWMTKEDHIETSEKPCLLAKHTISCLFDGGNCKYLDYPPFTFKNLDLSNVDVLKVKGYDENKNLVKEVVYNKRDKAIDLQIDVREENMPLCANDDDFVFVYVTAVDELAHADVDYQQEITLNVENGSTIGHSTINAEIGTAAFLVKADKLAKEVVLTAKSDLMSKTYTLKTNLA